MGKDGDDRRNGEMEMAMRGGRDAEPLFVKIGVGVALPFAGMLLSHLLRRRSPPSPEAAAEPEDGSQHGGGLKEELRVLKSEDALSKVENGGSTSTTTTAAAAATALAGLSPTSKSSGDEEEGFFLPEFSDLVLNEFEATEPDTETTLTPRKLEPKDDAGMEHEIAQLRNLVWSLQEREKSLELQLLEYYGMQEQEAALRELQNQVKVNNAEAKLYSLKIEALQMENRRLQAQVSDYSKTLTELEAAKSKIKLLKKKLKLEVEQAKEKIASLQQSISSDWGDTTDDDEAEKKLKRLKVLEDEAAELKLANSKLVHENMELMKKLELAQNPASSFYKSQEAKSLQEADDLRQENDRLTKDIEQLQIDRCADVEQLVYLRWINACLRYELRNYQPPPGKTVARDLSKNLSPKSEEAAKQLILEYGADEKSSGIIEFDSEYSSGASTAESDDTSNDVASISNSTSKDSSTSKSKFFSKLRTLVLGKETYKIRADSVSGRSFTDAMDRHLCDSFSSCLTEDLIADDQWQSRNTRSLSFGRHSMDIQRIRRPGLEEFSNEKCESFRENFGAHYRCDGSISRGKSVTCSGQSNPRNRDEADVPEMAELRKFADALKNSRSGTRSNRRSASFGN